MSIGSHQETLSVALIGNPNTGKSTLFGALAGIRQRVGNYPGVTVEKRTGQMDHGGKHYELIDLPGLYSLAPRSRDEMVAVDVLFGRVAGLSPVDLVVCIVDASNLARNLYLVSQVLELGRPTVVVLNMVDVARSRGIEIDPTTLGERLGVPVVCTQANRQIGVEQLREAIDRAPAAPVPPGDSPLPAAFEAEVRGLEQCWQDRFGEGINGAPLPRFLLRRLILDVGGTLQASLWPQGDGQLGDELATIRQRLADARCEVPGVETSARYAWVDRVLEGVVERSERAGTSSTDRLDRVLTHRVWGSLIFALVMIVVFQAVFSWAQPLMDGIDAGVTGLGTWVESWMADGAFRSLLVDGILGGVGGVAVFVPQILVLFIFIGVLEDCGYMARAAYLMDKLMVRAGLSGKSFIPMLSSFACAIPGIMAARVIEDERDRLTTILVAPLLTCSARLPIYALLIAAFVPNVRVLGPLGLQGVTLVGLYGLGIVAAVTVALVLKRTLLRGQTPPFVIELPSYKWPSLGTILHRVLERGWLFVRCAGTIILAVSIIVWAGLYYPHDKAAVESQPAIEQMQARLEAMGPAGAGYASARRELDRQLMGAYQRQSYLGRLGRLVEPVFRPLGWDWRISCAVIASFPAREVVVATLGVIYNLGEDLDPDSQEGLNQFSAKLQTATWDGSHRKVFTVPVALSMMVFFALCAQCVATLAVIRRETNSLRWPLFTFMYMTTLAYIGAWVTYQVGTWIG